MAELGFLKLETDFFSDEKVVGLIAEHGANGVVVYLAALCRIFRGRGALSLDNRIVRVLARDTGVHLTTVNKVLKTCGELELFNAEAMEQGQLWSDGAAKRIESINKEREGWKERQKRWREKKKQESQDVNNASRVSNGESRVSNALITDRGRGRGRGRGEVEVEVEESNNTNLNGNSLGTLFPNETDQRPTGRNKKSKSWPPAGKREVSQNVYLDPAEYARLVTEQGEQRTLEACSFLSAWVAEDTSGKRFREHQKRDHNLVLRRWVFAALDRAGGSATRPVSNSKQFSAEPVLNHVRDQVKRFQQMESNDETI